MIVSNLSFQYFTASLKLSQIMVELKKGNLENEDLIIEQIIEIYNTDPRQFNKIINGAIDVILSWLEEIDMETFLRKVVEIPKESILEYSNFIKPIVNFGTYYKIIYQKNIEKIAEKFENISPELQKKLEDIGKYIEEQINEDKEKGYLKNLDEWEFSEN